MTDEMFRKRAALGKRIMPGDVVTGQRVKNGETTDVIGRVAVVNSLGGILVEMDNGRLAGFDADAARALVIMEYVDTPYETSDYGDLYFDPAPTLPVARVVRR